ncbi:MAG: hypothetical protein HGA87_01505 [Desulfobulbaceae bacterium]|nr:hypothetical protein [Desulfobulbaceae bacterium]
MNTIIVEDKKDIKDIRKALDKNDGRIFSVVSAIIRKSNCPPLDHKKTYFIDYLPHSDQYQIQYWPVNNPIKKAKNSYIAKLRLAGKAHAARLKTVIAG